MSSKIRMSGFQRERSREFRRLCQQHKVALDEADVHRAAGRHVMADGCIESAEKIQADLDRHIAERKR